MPPAGSRDRRAGRAARGEVRRLEEPLDVGAVAHVAERVLERELDAADLVRQRRLERLEQPERLERDDALGRRRQLAAPRRRGTRSRSGSTQRGAYAARSSSSSHEAAQIASATAPAVEGGRPLARRSARSVRAELGEPDDAHRPTGGWRRAPAGRARGAPRPAAAIGATANAALGGVDRVGEARVEPEPAVAARRARPSRATAPGTVTERGPLLARPAPTGSAPAGAGPAASSPTSVAVAPDQREAVAADAGRHRLGDAEHGGRGQRRVGRVAAALERPQPGRRGERLARRDHRLGRDGRRPARCVRNTSASGRSAQPVGRL